LKFKGGKGVSTMAGLLLALAPLSLLVGGAVWAIFFYSFRYVSLASICASLTLPVSAYFLSKYEVYKLSDTLQWILIILAALVIFRHKGNIIRLMTGTESRFTKK
jgi:glycerol-3-phosphate acyltransferase PlsY